MKRFEQRVRELEKEATAIPLWLRQWLGDALSAEERAEATRQLATRRANGPASIDTLKPELRAWLADRESGNAAA